MASVELVLASIWAFRKYSDSRWLAIAPSARSLVAASVTCIAGYIEWILRQPHKSRYYTGGFTDNHDAPIAHLIASVAMSSFPADAALASMMEDDRLAVTIDSIEGDVASEVAYVQSLPVEVWDIWAERCRWNGAALRYVGTAMCLTSASFLLWRLHPLHGLPWTLVRGEIKSNASDLASGEKP